MQHTIELLNDTTALVCIIGDGDDQVAQEFVDLAEQRFQENGNKKLNAIVDMTESGDSTYKGILIYRDFFNDTRLGKIIFVAPTPAIKTLIKVATTGKAKDVSFADSVEEAKKILIVG